MCNHIVTMITRVARLSCLERTIDAFFFMSFLNVFFQLSQMQAKFYSLSLYESGCRSVSGRRLSTRHIKLTLSPWLDITTESEKLRYLLYVM